MIIIVNEDNYFANFGNLPIEGEDVSASRELLGESDQPQNPKTPN